MGDDGESDGSHDFNDDGDADQLVLFKPEMVMTTLVMLIVMTLVTTAAMMAIIVMLIMAMVCW